LDGAAADRGHLHRLLRAGEMLPRLGVTDDAPAHGPEYLPPAGPRRIDLATAGTFVSSPQLLARTEATGRLVDRAEAPALHAHPAEILDRIAEMRALPVEDRRHAGLVGEIVARAIVAVHQPWPLDRR